MSESISDLISQNTEAWLRWNRLYPKTKDLSLPIAERRKYCEECEAINEAISDITNKIDKIFAKC